MTDDISKKVNRILDLMQEGDSVVNYTNNTNVILILGNTGAGKSTLTHFMAGNNDHLISKEVNDGSGEYLIEDLNDKIGKSISSKTRFPELMIDPETNTAFYDMPGFSDTRSTEQEISAAYCTKKVIDRYSNIKLVFVINYSSVRIGVDRRDFMLLVDHATTLIKDVTKFQNSVALVVSKVDNTIVKKGKIYELVSDEKIIETVVNFLRNVKLDCENYIRNNSTKDIYVKAIQFIDLFLIKNEHEFINIGLFRRPDEPGKLSEIALMQDGKKKLENIVYNNLIYKEKGEGDFGYTVSFESKLCINDLIIEIYKKTSSQLNEICNQAIKAINENKNNSTDIFELQERFVAAQRYFNIDNIINPNPVNVAKFVINFMSRENIIIQDSFLKSIITYNSHIHFLRSLYENSSTNDLEPIWIDTINNLSNYISEQLKIYEHLIKIYHRLSKYDIQVSVNDSIAKTCYKELKLQNKPPLQSIEKLTDIDLSEISLDIPQNIILCNILNFTMSNTIEIQYVTDKLIVRAAYLKFKWEVIGERVINLNGANGKYLPPAKDGISWSDPNGKGGIPGLPGKPGGNFYGIVGTVINGGHLTISANGGNGGTGQKGGNGVNGKIGLSPPDPDENSTKKKYSQFSMTETSDKLIVPAIVYNYARHSAFYIVKGHEGSNGGNGGNGGIGGFGGKKGNITVIALNKSEIKIKLNDGRTGEDGKGGNGGRGGLDVKTESVNELKSRNKTSPRQDGNAGYPGYNKYSRTLPEPPSELILSNQTDTFINYCDTFYRGSVIQSKYELFLNKLKSHPKAKRLFQFNSENDSVESQRKRRSLDVNHQFTEVARNGATSQSKSLINYSLNWVVTELIAFNPMTVLTNWWNCIDTFRQIRNNPNTNLTKCHQCTQNRTQHPTPGMAFFDVRATKS
ncbi:uncharacterized protein LOC126265406 [Aethina tumida]|uniref:uncharacterized protein LOC126265406 n=1 Tax=Aethina tumida TaxID=116153 RepID=UPI0021472439|nr:uncharacterized protein LOC126265406 [Aethina tumida]